MEKNIMYNFTSEDHRIRLENIRLIETNLKFIPYFAYANRGETDMLVWVLKK